MATYSGQDFTSFRGVNFRGSIALRFAADVSGNESTLAVKPSDDTSRAYYFPQKSGTFGITGTFGVDLPIVASSGYLSTIVTVAGIRTEDAVLVVPQNRDAAGVISARGALFVANAVPGNGNITILLVNAFATATVVSTQTVFAYTAMR